MPAWAWGFGECARFLVADAAAACDRFPKHGNGSDHSEAKCYPEIETGLAILSINGQDMVGISFS